MPADLVPLNLFDRFIFATEQVFKSRGLPGLHFVMLMLFRDRIDLLQLRDSVDRVVTRWPLLTARLTRKPFMAWTPTGCRTVPIREIALESDSDEELVRTCEQLRAEPFDIEAQDPIRLMVLHRPGGGDVLALQGSHVLIDIHSCIGVLKQIMDPTQIPPKTDETEAHFDPFAVAMGEHSFITRMRAMRAMLRQWRKTSPVTFPGLKKKLPKRPAPGPVTLRWLDEEATAALEARARAISPFASLTLVATASGFRTLQKFVGGRQEPNSVYEIMLPYNLRRGKQKENPYHNIVKRMLLTARPDQLGNRDELVRLLSAQFREHLSNPNHQHFLAQLQGAAILVLLSEKLPWLIPRLGPPRTRSLRISSSPDILGYGTKHLGATFEGHFFNLPCHAPVGATLDLFKIGKRILMVFMHAPEALTVEQAAQFFDDWVEDLVADGPAPAG